MEAWRSWSLRSLASLPDNSVNSRNAVKFSFEECVVVRDRTHDADYGLLSGNPEQLSSAKAILELARYRSIEWQRTRMECWKGQRQRRT